jgi:SAM-dependent methyltransferase
VAQAPDQKALRSRVVHALLSKLAVFRWHYAKVSTPRAERLATALADIAPPSRSMLDIGSSDGLLARETADRLGVTDVRGVDIKIQPHPGIPVEAYDGRTLPFEDGRFDLVTICDVLHHAEDPLAVVREALRVLTPDGALVIKDHFRWGRWSNGVLLAMDIVGNYKAGVIVTGNYLSAPDWIDLIAEAGGTIDRLVWPLEIHDLPWRIITRSEYQFVMRVRGPRQAS